MALIQYFHNTIPFSLGLKVVENITKIIPTITINKITKTFKLRVNCRHK